jgi:hypothetical protein
MTRTLAVLTAVAALAISVDAASAAPGKPSTQSPAVSTFNNTMVSGIIMRDGGVCDPIRHMGC